MNSPFINNSTLPFFSIPYSSMFHSILFHVLFHTLPYSTPYSCLRGKNEFFIFQRLNSALLQSPFLSMESIPQSNPCLTSVLISGAQVFSGFTHLYVLKSLKVAPKKQSACIGYNCVCPSGKYLVSDYLIQVSPEYLYNRPAPNQFVHAGKRENGDQK